MELHTSLCLSLSLSFCPLLLFYLLSLLLHFLPLKLSRPQRQVPRTLPVCTTPPPLLFPHPRWFEHFSLRSSSNIVPSSAYLPSFVTHPPTHTLSLPPPPPLFLLILNSHSIVSPPRPSPWRPLPPRLPPETVKVCTTRNRLLVPLPETHPPPKSSPVQSRRAERGLGGGSTGAIWLVRHVPALCRRPWSACPLELCFKLIWEHRGKGSCSFFLFFFLFGSFLRGGVVLLSLGVNCRARGWTLVRD